MPDKKLGRALLSLKDDEYLDVILYACRDQVPLIEIAEELGCSSRTVTRQKKRLLEEIKERYESL